MEASTKMSDNKNREWRNKQERKSKENEITQFNTVDRIMSRQDYNQTADLHTTISFYGSCYESWKREKKT